MYKHLSTLDISYKIWKVFKVWLGCKGRLLQLFRTVYEALEGDKTTGNYMVVLPDGFKQMVIFYVSDVKYEG